MLYLVLATASATAAAAGGSSGSGSGGGRGSDLGLDLGLGATGLLAAHGTTAGGSTATTTATTAAAGGGTALLILVVDEGAGLNGVLRIVLGAAPVGAGLGVLEDVLEATVVLQVADTDRLAVDADEGVDAVEVAALFGGVLGEETAPAARVLGVLEEELEALVLHEVLDGDGELLALDADDLGVVVDTTVDVGAAKDIVDDLVVAPDTLGGGGGGKEEGDTTVEEEVGDVDGSVLALDGHGLVVLDLTQVDVLAGSNLVGSGDGAPLSKCLGGAHGNLETLVLEEVGDGDGGGLTTDGDVGSSLGGGAVEEGAGLDVVGTLAEAPAGLGGGVGNEVLDGRVGDKVGDGDLGVLTNGKAGLAGHCF